MHSELFCVVWYVIMLGYHGYMCILVSRVYSFIMWIRSIDTHHVCSRWFGSVMRSRYGRWKYLLSAPSTRSLYRTMLQFESVVGGVVEYRSLSLSCRRVASASLRICQIFRLVNTTYLMRFAAHQVSEYVWVIVRHWYRCDVGSVSSIRVGVVVHVLLMRPLKKLCHPICCCSAKAWVKSAWSSSSRKFQSISNLPSLSHPFIARSMMGIRGFEVPAFSIHLAMLWMHRVISSGFGFFLQWR